MALPTDRELAILRRVLGDLGSAGADQLVDQLRMLQVAPNSDATTRIYLLHPDAPRAASSRDARSKVGTWRVRSPDGRVKGELAVWVDHGHLRALHYVPATERDALMLPDPGRVDVRQPDTAMRVHGVRRALAGVQTLHAQLDANPSSPAAGTESRSTIGRLARAAMVLLVIAVAVSTFLGARSGGIDLGTARTAGAAAGAADGAAAGTAAGTATGSAEGERAGREAARQPAFDQARAQALTRARRAAAVRRQAQRAAAAAAAAAAAPLQYTDNTNCSGYRDSRGYWVCS